MANIDAGIVEGTLVLRDLASQVAARASAALHELGQQSLRTSAAVDQAAAKWTAFGARLEQLGGSLKRAGSSLTMGLTLPMAATAAGALKMGMDFDRSMTQVVTIAGVAESQMASFRREILETAGALGRGPTELSKGLLVAASFGQRGKEAMEIVAAAAKAAALGLGETNDITRALVAAVNAYGAENLSAARAADILFAAVREGGAEATELAGTLGRVIGLASQVGVSFEEATAFVASFTRLGVDASEAVTSLRGVLTAAVSPTKDAAAALASVGMSASDLRAAIVEKGLQRTLVDLMEAFRGDAAQAEALFGNVRALSGVLANAGSQAKSYGEIVEALKRSHGDLDKAFERIKGTPAQTWAEFKAQVEVASIALGEQLAPALSATLTAMHPVLDAAAKAATAFSSLPGPVQTTVLALGGLLLTAGPILRLAGTVVTLTGRLIALAATTTAVAALEKALLALSLTLARIPGFTALASGVAAFAAQATAATAAVYGLVAALAVLVGMAAAKIWTAFEEGARDSAEAARKAAENTTVLQWAIERGLTPNAKGVYDLAEAQRMFTQAAEASTRAALGLSAAIQPMASHTSGAAASLRMMASHGTETTTATRTLTDQLRASKAALDAASAAELENVRAGLAMGKTTDQIVTALRSMAGGATLTAEAIELYKERLAAADRASAKAARAQEELREELAKTHKLLARVETGLPDGLQTLHDGFVEYVRSWGRNLDLLRDAHEKLAVERTRIERGELAARLLEVEHFFAAQARLVDRSALDADKALAALDALREHTLSALIAQSEEAAVVLRAVAAALAGLPGAGSVAAAILDQIDGFRAAGTEAARTFASGWKQFHWAVLADSVLRALEGGGSVGKALATALGTELMRAFERSTSAAGRITAGLGAGLVAGLQGASVTVQRESKALGALAGGAMGAAMGAQVAGPLGAVVGGLIGTLGGLFGNAAAKARDLRAELVRSAGGMEQLREAAAYAGVSLDAFLNAKRTKEVQAAFDRVAAAVAATRKRVQELVAEVAKVEQAGHLISRDLLRRVAADRGTPEVQQALDAFLRANTARGVEGLNAYLALRPDTVARLTEAQRAVADVAAREAELLRRIEELNARDQLTPEQERQLATLREELGAVRAEMRAAQGAVDRLGTALDQLTLSPETASALQAAVGGLFGDLVAQGTAPIDAVAALRPSIEALTTRMRELGLEASPAFTEIQRLAELAADEVAGPLLSAMAGLGRGLVGLHNTGLLTREMFAGLARGAYDAFHALELQGRGGVDAVRGLQPTLQRIWELQQDFGYEVDEATQKLLDFAAASGLIGDRFRPAQDQMARALDALLTRFDRLIDLFTRILPGSGQEATDQLNRALRGIDFEDVRTRGVQAFQDIEEAAARAAWGSSPTGIKEIPIATEQATEALARFGAYATQVFDSVEALAASYARQVVAGGDDMGALLVSLSQTFEDLVATPLQKTLNGIDRELSATLTRLARFKDDPRYEQAVALAQTIADLKGREAVAADRDRARAAADRSYSGGASRPIEQVIIVHLDGHVLTEAHVRDFPEVAKVLGR